MLFKKLGKIVYVGHAAVLSHGLYLQSGGEKQAGCEVHSPLGYVFRNGLANLAAELGGKVAGVDVLGSGKGAEAQVGSDV